MDGLRRCSGCPVLVKSLKKSIILIIDHITTNGYPVLEASGRGVLKETIDYLLVGYAIAT